MVTLVVDEGQSVSVPAWVTDLEAFRRWTDEPDFPEDCKVWWLKGDVWIYVSKEQIFTHVLVKTEITMALRLLSKQENLGIYLTDGVLLSNFEADISGNPDGLFISAETLASDSVRLIEGRDGGFVELQGSPDMVLEILSKSSERKDNVILKQAYHEAGVREYWLVDAWTEPITFDVYRRTAKKFVRTPKQEGWVRSAVFDRSFRLTVRQGIQKHPDYSLDVR